MESKSVYILDTSQKNNCVRTVANHLKRFSEEKPEKFNFNVTIFSGEGAGDKLSEALKSSAPDILIINAGEKYANIDKITVTRKTGIAVVVATAQGSPQVIKDKLDHRQLYNVAIIKKSDVEKYPAKLVKSIEEAIERAALDKEGKGRKNRSGWLGFG